MEPGGDTGVVLLLAALTFFWAWGVLVNLLAVGALAFAPRSVADWS